MQALEAKLTEVQGQLERLYQLESGPNICQFLRLDADNGSERLLVRQGSVDNLELALVLPANINAQARATAEDHLELVEGVSHFVHIIERARLCLPTTQLELELQAEVDKFVLLRILEPEIEAALLLELLFERVRYFHAADTEQGRRYRLANYLAARFCSRLIKNENEHRRSESLRRFYRAGQSDKLYLAHAA